jgi:hypothetical protein
MECLFNEQFSKLIKNKKQVFIPTREKYDGMVAKLIEFAEDPKKRLMGDLNLIRRHKLHEEHDGYALYHIGDAGKDSAQKVVHQDEVYNLLLRTHQKLGHAGVGGMWKELRTHYGISKYVINDHFINIILTAIDLKKQV